MEVKLKAGDSLNIPEGCKAVIKGNVVVFEKEFQEGDVLHSIHSGVMVIFKKNTSDTCFSSHYDNLGGSGSDAWPIKNFRHATEEEKQLILDKMKEQGLRWNAENKCVEKVRWRSGNECFFYFMDTDFEVGGELDNYTSANNSLWNNYNYFRIPEHVEEAAKRVKETLRKYHEEIGE